MTMHQRYKANPSGCDSFNTWMRPYDELHAKFPLGCAKVGEEWLDLWEGLGEMLKMPARLEVVLGEEVFVRLGNMIAMDVASCIETHYCAPMFGDRVVLHDGTIIKEWGAK